MHIIIPPISNPTVGPAATPVAFINAILSAYQRYRGDPRHALRQAQIPPEHLNNPANRVTAAQMEIVSAIAMQELDDEALGWFSRKLPWGSYGMLCRASLTSPNLGIAIKRWCRHHRLLTDDIELNLSTTRTTATVDLLLKRDLGDLQEFCLVTSLRYLLGYACWVIDSRITLLDAGFPFYPPPHHQIYTLLFPGPIRFGIDRGQISFDAQYLSLPLRRDERDLRQMLLRALPLTVLPYRRDRLLGQKVRQLLYSNLNKAVTAEWVSTQLHVSSRTLHRHLQEEGSSLQKLKDDIRKQRAIELLTRTERSIKQIALASGFRNEKSFTRAFRKWTELPPSAFRQGQTHTSKNHA